MIKILARCCKCSNKVQLSYFPIEMHSPIGTTNFAHLIENDLKKKGFLTSNLNVYCEKCAKDKKKDLFGGVIE